MGDIVGSIAKSNVFDETRSDEEYEYRSKHRNNFMKMQQIINQAIVKGIKSVGGETKMMSILGLKKEESKENCF